MKSIKRFTQTVKRTVNSNSQIKDNEYEVLMNLAAQQEKTLITFDKHAQELIKNVQAQITLAKNCCNDYKMIYQNDNDFTEPEVVQELTGIVGKLEARETNPFTERCQSEVIQPIRDYLHELQEASKGALIKQRHKKQLDLEYARDKYNSISAKTSAQPQQVEELKLAFERAKYAFDECDEQAKVHLREVVVKRYTVFHPVVTELFGELLAEYYIQLASYGQQMKKLKSMSAPAEPIAASYADSSFDAIPSQPKSLAPKPALPNKTLPPPPRADLIPKHLDVEWFYLDAAHNQQGPVTVSVMKGLMRDGLIDNNSYICCEGMGTWATVGEHEVHKYL